MVPEKRVKKAKGIMKNEIDTRTSGAVLLNSPFSVGTSARTAFPDKGPMNAPR
jgi:hypothetical protein